MWEMHEMSNVMNVRRFSSKIYFHFVSKREWPQSQRTSRKNERMGGRKEIALCVTSMTRAIYYTYEKISVRFCPIFMQTETNNYAKESERGK